MALTTFCVYNTTTDELVSVKNRDSGDAPTPGAGEAVKDLGLRHPLPGPVTHTFDQVADDVAAKSQSTIDSDADAKEKAQIERTLGMLDACKANMTARAFSVVAIDADILALETRHAAL